MRPLLSIGGTRKSPHENCSGNAHGTAADWYGVGVLAYPVGIPLVYAALLRSSRVALHARRNLVKGRRVLVHGEADGAAGYEGKEGEPRTGVLVTAVHRTKTEATEGKHLAPLAQALRQSLGKRRMVQKAWGGEGFAEGEGKATVTDAGAASAVAARAAAGRRGRARHAAAERVAGRARRAAVSYSHRTGPGRG